MPEYVFEIWLQGGTYVTIEAESAEAAEEALYDDGMDGQEFYAAFSEMQWDWEVLGCTRDGQDCDECEDEDDEEEA